MRLVNKTRFTVGLAAVLIILVSLTINNIKMNNNSIKAYKELQVVQKEKQKIEEEKIELNKIITEQSHTLNELHKIQSDISQFDQSINDATIFKVTAYDLSVKSCGKKKTHREYGIAASGISLENNNWESARVIAVDPKVIPLGSIVYIQFLDKGYEKHNGIYYALDTGSAIKGNKIDLFFEDTGDKRVSRGTINFGVTSAKVIILSK